MVVQCTWKTSDGRDVSSAVIWTEDPSEEDNNIEDVVEEQHCHLLFAPNTGSAEYLTVPACQLLLSCQPPDQITYLSVLSEAKVIELYGHHGEYIETVYNSFIDEIDDTKVFRGDVKLARPLQVCSIKFANLKTKDEMWLYGVKAITSKAARPMNDSMPIQYAEVERRLLEMNSELSENAEAFKQLVLGSQRNASQPNVGAVNRLFSQAISDLVQGKFFFPQSQAHPPSDLNNANAEALNKNVNELENGNEKCVPMQVSHSFQSTQTDPSPEPKIDFDDMKEYFNNRLEELEKQMHEKMQKQLKEIEMKLLCKMEEIESFVRPQGVQPKM